MSVLAYIIVIVLAALFMSLGMFAVGLPLAFLLAWAPISVRTTIAGGIGGVAGVVAAVAFGFGVFHLLVGPGSFTIGPFLASVLPLLIPVRRDMIQATQVKEAQDQLRQTITANHGEDVAEFMATETTTAHRSSVCGEVMGLLLVSIWFITR